MTSKSASEIYLEGWQAGWAPDPELTVAQWANTHIQLSSKASSEPGQFRTERTPYVTEILESLSPTSKAQRVVWQAGAQVAKTQSGLNWIGAVIDQWPGPMLFVLPTVDMAKKVSKQRIAPLIEGTKVLREKISESRSRDSGNTLFEKEFPGGMLMLTGANSASGLRSMPIRYLFCDEIDAYPTDVEEEGSPLDLAEKRTTTFSRRKVFLSSTPTIKGHSAVEREFDRSDKRYYYVPCPHCGEYDRIEWPNIVWDEGQPETARLRCNHCACLIEERHKPEMLANGQWRATAVGDGTVGYHLNGLYSPLGWKSWAMCVAEFLDSKSDPSKLKVFVNTVLAQTWEEKGDSVDAGSLAARVESYVAEVPAGVRIITCSVDVQGDRLEVKVKGYGEREESWLIAYSQIHGDPATQAPWDELDQFLATPFEREGGGTARIDTTVVDSGYLPDIVLRYCKARTHLRVYAIRGHQMAGKEIVGKATYNNKYRAKQFIVGVDAAKDLIQSRMKIQTPGPGYMHLPNWVDEEYLAQLTSEKAIRKYVRGRGVVREWVKIKNRNEAFDLEVYCLAALYTKGPAFLAKLSQRNFSAESASNEPDAAETSGGIQSAAVASSSSTGKQNKWGGQGRWVDGWKV